MILGESLFGECFFNDIPVEILNGIVFFPVDVLLEKLNRSSFRMDLVIGTGSSSLPKSWSAQYVEPDQRTAF